MSEATAVAEQTEAQVEEAKADVKAKAKKADKTGDLIVDVSAEIESLTKQKALNEADKLAETVEVTYFRLGGVLNLISENSWFEGSESFGAFVKTRYGFEERKARYLISIYTNLVTKQIPWEKVSHLGWTKLKDLAPKLTPENVDEWVAKAEKLSVVELQALLKADTAGSGESTAKTTDEVVKVTFKLKKDQSDIVTQALAKAKGELHTEYDTVALENICMGYLGGNTSVQSVDDILKSADFEALMTKVSELHPEWDINIQPAKAKE